MFTTISLTRNINNNTLNSFNHAYYGNSFGLKNCIENGFNLNTKNAEGNTVLHISSKRGKQNVLDMLLIDFGHLIQINQKNYQRKTAFGLACENGYLNIVQSLLEIPNIEINNVDFGGYIPILKTYKNGYINVLQFLIKYTIANYNFRRFTEYIPISVINFLENTEIEFSRLPRRPNWIVERSRYQPRIISLGFLQNFEQQIKKIPKYFINEHMDMLVELKKSCLVCYEEFEKNKISISEKCFHYFCNDCFSKIHSKCPLCRTNL
jgi:ankyrin repeat protein